MLLLSFCGGSSLGKGERAGAWVGKEWVWGWGIRWILWGQETMIVLRCVGLVGRLLVADPRCGMGV